MPGGVEPICLLNDAVTGGGYATIGTVISVVIALVYSFVVTFVIAKVLDAVIGLRATEAEERAGLDISLHEEQSYVLAE